MFPYWLTPTIDYFKRLWKMDKNTLSSKELKEEVNRLKNLKTYKKLKAEQEPEGLDKFIKGVKSFINFFKD